MSAPCPDRLLRDGVICRCVLSEGHSDEHDYTWIDVNPYQYRPGERIPVPRAHCTARVILKTGGRCPCALPENHSGDHKYLWLDINAFTGKGI